MKKIFCLLSVLAMSLLLLSKNSSAVDAASVVPNGTIGQQYNWSLIFEDNFSSPPINSAKWSPCIYWGITSNGCWENTENLEWYMPGNSAVSNGMLTIQGRKENVTTPKGNFNYTSGLVTTDRASSDTSIPAKFDFLYGYAEIRAQVPKGKGLWPAFWMLTSDHSDGEIDVMEILGDHPETGYMTFHWGSGKSFGKSWTISGTDFSQGYHTFAVDWSPSAIVWYIDGVERQRLTDSANIVKKPMNLIANLQIGGDWAGSPDATTVFPANYNIDYIRVWKKGSVVVNPTATNSPLVTISPAPTSSTVPTPAPRVVKVKKLGLLDSFVAIANNVSGWFRTWLGVDKRD